MAAFVLRTFEMNFGRMKRERRSPVAEFCERMLQTRVQCLERGKAVVD